MLSSGSHPLPLSPTWDKEVGNSTAKCHGVSLALFPLPWFLSLLLHHPANWFPSPQIFLLSPGQRERVRTSSLSLTPQSMVNPPGCLCPLQLCMCVSWFFLPLGTHTPKICA